MTRSPALRALAGIATAGVLAACGSGSPSTGSGPGSGAATGKAGSMLAFARCMRVHGVPSFPDPTGNGGIQVQATPNSTTVNGVAVNGPAFQSAMRTCQPKLPGGGPGSGPAPAAVRQATLRFAQCMRSHGVPNFPDPRVTANGGRVAVQIGGPGSAINPQSPAFQSAERLCRPIIAARLGVGPAVAKGP